MGFVYADIELANGYDIEKVRRGEAGEDEVKYISINILVDTGSFTLAINENIQKILQLPIIDKKRMELADGNVVFCDIVSLVNVKFRNRRCNCDAVVLPGDSEPLFGAIPLEYMDLIIHPQRQELLENPEHGRLGMWKLKQMWREAYNTTL